MANIVKLIPNKSFFYNSFNILIPSISDYLQEEIEFVSINTNNSGILCLDKDKDIINFEKMYIYYDKYIHSFTFKRTSIENGKILFRKEKMKEIVKDYFIKKGISIKDIVFCYKIPEGLTEHNIRGEIDTALYLKIVSNAEIKTEER